MKIIYLHQYFNTPRMAGSIRSYEMARRLVSRGHEVHMVTSDRDEAPRSPDRWTVTDEDGIVVHWTHVPYSNRMSLKRRLRAFFEFSIRAAGKAASLDGDVIFATSTPLTIALPAIYASRLRRIPMVFEVRDLWPDVPVALGALRNPIQRWAAYWLESLAYRSSAEIVTLAPGMKQAIVEKGYPAEQISVIPNGANFDLFGTGDSDMALREQFAWLGERPLCVYTGSVGRVHGVEYLVDLAFEVHRLDPKICFVILGDGSCVHEVQRIAEQRGVLDANFYMLGQRPKEDAVRWLRSADIALATMDGPEMLMRDSVLNKFFDALAASKPVAHNFEGFSATLAKRAGAGVILDRTNLPHAAKQLVSAVNDKSWLRSAAIAAERLGREHFNLDDLALRLEEALFRARDRDMEGSGRQRAQSGIRVP